MPITHKQVSFLLFLMCKLASKEPSPTLKTIYYSLDNSLEYYANMDILGIYILEHQCPTRLHAKPTALLTVHS